MNSVATARFPLARRFDYYQRIFQAYLTRRKSHLNFWHETPEMNPNFVPGELGEYYMTFAEKADYTGHYDDRGIPMLDYQGKIGLQYNPIAVAQYGLGNYNLYYRTQQHARKDKVLNAADWLVSNLEQTSHGVWVWNHKFDWEYRTPLRAPWYSGLAQGQGISLLVRAHSVTKDQRYVDAAARAFHAFLNPFEQGGVTYLDPYGGLWFEEYIVSPPTHILNGFIWAAWGVYDFFLATGAEVARRIFLRAVNTLMANLQHYDLGFWSLYEHSGTQLKMIASPFYHRLHIVQLRAMQRLTGEALFGDYADRWERYRLSRTRRTAAILYKSAFKLCYY